MDQGTNGEREDAGEAAGGGYIHTLEEGRHPGKQQKERRAANGQQRQGRRRVDRAKSARFRPALLLSVWSRLLPVALIPMQNGEDIYIPGTSRHQNSFIHYSPMLDLCCAYF
jgi:hypothetical protein